MTCGGWWALIGGGGGGRGGLPELCLSAFKSGGGAERRLMQPTDTAADADEGEEWMEEDKRGVRERREGMEDGEREEGEAAQSQRTWIIRKHRHCV